MIKILIVDDELEIQGAASDAPYMSYYTDALEKCGFDVVKVQRVRGVVDLLRSKCDSFGVIVLDLMMGPDGVYSLEETDFGIHTGVRLLEDIAGVAATVPIVVLTNLNDREILSSLSLNASVRRVVNKLDCTPFQLCEIIRDIVN